MLAHVFSDFFIPHVRIFLADAGYASFVVITVNLEDGVPEVSTEACEQPIVLGQALCDSKIWRQQQLQLVIGPNIPIHRVEYVEQHVWE